MSFNLRETNLAQLNSLTKYPSIFTYHLLDASNGGLLEEIRAFQHPAIATEKVDGTNARIIILPDRSYVLGSREELLYARGDLIGNPALGIIDALKETAERLCDTLAEPDAITVLYSEVFGGKVTSASKQYTGSRQVGVRLFDVVRQENYKELLALPIAELSAWREHGGQSFLPEPALQAIAAEHGLALTPRLFSIEAAELPTTIAATQQFLRERLGQSLCMLDNEAGGRPEGIVLRTADRSQIVKLRFEDYERTLRRKK